MKRIAILLLLILFTCTMTLSYVPFSAAAEEDSYLQITKEGVCLYENTVVQDVLFTLPRTYYVKVVKANLTSLYHLVEYNGVTGLVKSAEVSATPVTNISNPYYTDTTISANAGQYLYAKPSFSEQTNIEAWDLTLLYFGKTSGEKRNYGTSTWYAVLYTGKVYFIHSAMTENLDLLEKDVPPHPSSVTEPVETDGGSTDKQDAAQPSESVDVVRILLIIGMIVPIVIILVVLFRPKKRSKSSSDGD